MVQAMKRAAIVLLAAAGACSFPHVDFPGDVDDSPMVLPVDDPDTECGALSAASLSKCVERERIERDVREIAKPRPPASEQHDHVQGMCASRLGELGFQVELMRYESGVNVIGIKPGFSKPEEQVVVAAHYDHLPNCEGADDNASGVAAVLETARVLSQARFDRSLVIACWDEAERGQLGSMAFAKRAKARDVEVVVAMNYESVGFVSTEPDSQRVPDDFEKIFPNQALALLDDDHRGNFLMIVAGPGSADWAHLVADHGKQTGLPVQVLKLSERQKYKGHDDMHVSDHVSFWKNEFPSLLFTDSGRFRNPHLHCRTGRDAPDTLDYGFAAHVTRSALMGVVSALELR
jgi:hypothetical protein